MNFTIFLKFWMLTSLFCLNEVSVLANFSFDLSFLEVMFLRSLNSTDLVTLSAACFEAISSSWVDGKFPGVESYTMNSFKIMSIIRRKF